VRWRTRLLTQALIMNVELVLFPLLLVLLFLGWLWQRAPAPPRKTGGEDTETEKSSRSENEPEKPSD